MNIPILRTLKPELQYFISFVLGLLSALAFAPVFLFPILLITFPCFLVLISYSTKKSSFLLGWWFGFGYFIAGLYWISFALLVDINSFGWLIPVAVLLMPAITAIYIGFIGLLTKILSKNKYQLLVNFICLWVLFEIIRVNILTGSPWLLLGYSLCFWDAMLQSASVFGIYGLSFIVLCVVCTPYLLLDHYKKLDSVFITIALLIFTTNFGFGYFRLQNSTSELSNSMIRIVQANISQNLKWDYNERLNNLIKHANLTKQNNDKIDYVIWPESAISFPMSLQNRLRISDIIPKNSFLLVGGIRVNNEINPTEIWNSMFLINSTGQIIDFYDKIHLVPFGEYVPLKKFIPITKVTQGAIDFSPGSSLKTIKVSKNLPSFAPLICYEAYFPEDVVLKEQLPDFIVNFTNDAWYGNTSGPYQHLYMTKLRAIEQGIPIARAANTGISAIIDPYGRILKMLPLNKEGIIDLQLPKALKTTTIYSKYLNSIIFAIIPIFFLICSQSINKLTKFGSKSQ